MFDDLNICMSEKKEHDLTNGQELYNNFQDLTNVKQFHNKVVGGQLTKQQILGHSSFCQMEDSHVGICNYCKGERFSGPFVLTRNNTLALDEDPNCDTCGENNLSKYLLCKNQLTTIGRSVVLECWKMGRNAAFSGISLKRMIQNVCDSEISDEGSYVQTLAENFDEIEDGQRCSPEQLQQAFQTAKFHFRSVKEHSFYTHYNQNFREFHKKDENYELTKAPGEYIAVQCPSHIPPEYTERVAKCINLCRAKKKLSQINPSEYTVEQFGRDIQTRLDGLKTYPGGDTNSVYYVLKLARMGLQAIQKESPEIQYKSLVRRLEIESDDDDYESDDHDHESDDESDDHDDDDYESDDERPKKKRCVSP